jgi:hypothetical protein
VEVGSEPQFLTPLRWFRSLPWRVPGGLILCTAMDTPKEPEQAKVGQREPKVTPKGAQRNQSPPTIYTNSRSTPQAAVMFIIVTWLKHCGRYVYHWKLPIIKHCRLRGPPSADIAASMQLSGGVVWMRDFPSRHMCFSVFVAFVPCLSMFSHIRIQ